MDKYTDIQGLRLHYTDTEGSGPVVILMHGWGCNVSTVASIEAVCVDAGCRVVNVDMPGFGQSQEPPLVWGVEDYTQVVEALADKLGIKSPIVIGHSFGGRVGILMASRREVTKLVLVDAAGVKPRHSPRYYIKVYSFKAAKHTLNAVLGSRRAEPVINRMRGRAGSSDYASASPMMRAILSKVVNEDLCHVMPSIQAPTLLIYGANDTATPVRDAKRIASLVPDAGLVIVPDAGHYSFLDNRGMFRAVLTHFLKS